MRAFQCASYFAFFFAFAEVLEEEEEEEEELPDLDELDLERSPASVCERDGRSPKPNMYHSPNEAFILCRISFRSTWPKVLAFSFFGVSPDFSSSASSFRRTCAGVLKQTRPRST